MKHSTLIFLLFISTCLFAQEKKESNPKKVMVGFGMSLNLESLDKTIAEEVGLSSTGYTLIDFRGRLNLLKYINLDLGFYVSQFKDKLPFTQAVIFTSGQLAGLPSTGKSEIVSGGMYYSIGGRLPIIKRLYLNASLGNRRFSASRKVPDCQGCKKTDIDIQAGGYFRTGLSLLKFKPNGNALGEFDLLYTHYFDKAFENSITLGFWIYY